MRYAIVSDIHANLEAWQRVLEDAHAAKADTLVCLGDIVGYGPKPQEVVSLIRRDCANFVLGNHDAAVTGQLDASLFNDQARAVVEWTRGRLDPESIEFLSQMPLSIEAENALFVHAEAEEPGRFHYVETPEDAAASFAATGHQVIFIGHTHHPTAFVQSPEGAIIQVEDQDFQMEDANRYLVNVGSAGEPRNPEDIRARYVIYDSDTRMIEFRRVSFDAEVYRSHLVDSGLQIQPFFLRVIDHKTLAAAQEHAMVRDMETPIESVVQGKRPRSLVVSTMQVPTPAPRGTPTAADRKRARVESEKANSPLLIILLSVTLAVIGAGGFLLWKTERLPWQTGPSFEELAAASNEGESALETEPSEPAEGDSIIAAMVQAEAGGGSSAPAPAAPPEPEPEPELPSFEPITSAQTRGALANAGFENPKVKNWELKTPSQWQLLNDGRVEMAVRTVEPFKPFEKATGKQIGTLKEGTGLIQKLKNVPIQPKARYTFSFFQYEQNNLNDQGGGLRVELWEGHPRQEGDLLASAEFPATGSGKFARREAVLETPGSATPGASAFLVFRHVPDKPTGHRDNVSLDNILLETVTPIE